MSMQGHGGQYTEDHTTQQQYQQGGYPGAQRVQGYEQHQPSRGGQGGFGGSLGGRHGKPFFLTSEFLVLLAVIVAVVIAAAVDEGFGAARAWTLVTVLAAAYILSRGLSKIGSHNQDGSGFGN